MYLRESKLRKVLGTTLVSALGISLLASNPVLAKEGESKIGGHIVVDSKPEQLENYLNSKVQEWKQTPILVRDGKFEISLEGGLFEFDVKSAVELYTMQTDKPWYKLWEKTPVVDIPIEVNIKAEAGEKLQKVVTWDIEATLKEVEEQATTLGSHTINPIVVKDELIERERLSVVLRTIEDNDYVNITRVVELFNNTIIGSNKQLSILETIEKHHALHPQAVNLVSSVIYETFMQTDSRVLDRSINESLNSGIKGGYDVNISQTENKDLVIRNKSKHPMKLKVAIDGDSLKAEIYSQEKTVSVVTRVDSKTISPKVVYRYSDDLRKEESKVLEIGKNGLLLEVYRTISGIGESRTERVSRDYYAPINRVILISTLAEQGNAELEEKSKLDLDGDGLDDLKQDELGVEELPEGSYYDKGGNIVSPKWGDK